MKSLRLSCAAIAMALLMALSLPVAAATPLAAGAPDADDTTAVESNPVTDDLDRPASKTNTAADSQDTARIDQSIRDADGTITMIARLDELGQIQLQSSSDPVDALKTHAERSQQPLVEYAAATDGVEILREYWVTNAVVLEVDTNRVSIAEMAAIDGVTRFHENVKVNVPTPAKTEAPDVESDNGSVQTDGVSTDADPSAAADANATYGLDMINAPDVWDTYDTMGGGAKVAVLDTGVDVSHPDIDLYTENPDDPTYPGGFVNVTNAGDVQTDVRPHDDQFHGTHTSGTVAGGNASGQYIGVAPNADLIHGKVLHGDAGRGSFAGIVAGMQWAVEQNADVISMSLGADGAFPEFVEPVRNARDAGTVVVASAGNNGLGATGSPGNIYDSIAVGAVDENASVAAFSGGQVIDTEDAFGDAAPDDWPDQYVVPDVAAPGVNVTSAFPGGDYYAIHGTSMAAPHVAGAAALMVSASDSDVPDELVTEALIDSTWKPDAAPGYKDRRYGDGIIDVERAVASLKGDTGVTGVVNRSADGARLTGVPIAINGSVEGTTDGIGSYSIPTTPGTHIVSIDLPGFAPASTEVTVEDGEYAVVDFSLEHVFDLYETTPAPADAVRGESYEVTYQAWKHDNITVERVGDFGGNVTVEVQTNAMWSPEELTLGETYEFGAHEPDDYPDEVTLTVTPESSSGISTSDAGLGNVTLEATFNGTEGTTETKTLGPTTVHDGADTHDIGVISDPAVDDTVFDDPVVEELGPALAERLRSAMGDQHTVTHVGGVDDALAQLNEYDAFVVQHAEDTDALRTFVEKTSGAETGVVYLDQDGGWSDGITRLSEATGNPGIVRSQARMPFMNLDATEYSAISPTAANHSIVNVSTRSPEDIFDNHEVRDWPAAAIPVSEGSYLTWTSNHHTAQTVGKMAFEVEEGWFDPVATIDPIEAGDRGVYDDPVGQSVDGLTRTAILNGFGETAWGSNSYTEEADQVLANAVSWSASGTRSVSMTDGPDRKIEPGGSLNHTLAATGVENLTVDLNAEHSSVNETELDLFIEDASGTTEVAFGERFTPKIPRSGELTVRVETDAAAEGEIALDHIYETRDGNVTGATGPTSVYEGSQIRVSDGESLQTAVDTVQPGDEVVVEDGSYDRLWVHSDATNVTIRAAAGADPVIAAPEKPAGQFERGLALLHVSADGVTVDGIDVNASRKARPILDGVAVRHTMTERVEDVTIEDVTVTGAYNGVSVPRYAHGATVRNVRVEESFDAGIDVEAADGVLVEDSTVANSSRSGISVDSSEMAVLRDNTVVDPDGTGIAISGNTKAELRGNEITGAETGVDTGGGTVTAMVGNTIDRSSVGIDVTVQAEFQSQDAILQRIEDNAIAAKTGVRIGFPTSSEPVPEGTDYTGVRIRSNDLSGSTVAIAETTPNAGPLDARLNYYGPAGPADGANAAGDRPTVSGNVLADPFLPTPDADASSLDAAAFSTSVELEAGESYAVGVPGPVSGTVGDMLTDFEGVVYGFDAETGSWTQRTAGDSVGPLDALLVVPETNTTVVMDFGSTGDAPPSPSAHDLEEGWNFVSAPQYAPANESFGHSSAAISVVAPYFEQPKNQLADSDDPGSSFPIGDADGTPTVSAFTGYFVFAEDDGQLPARVGEDPTVESFHAELGLDDRPPVATGGEVSETDLSVAMRDGIRDVTAAVQDEHEENVSATFQAAIREEIGDVPADERATFVEIAADDLVTKLQSEPVANATELETLVEDTVEEAALVSADDTATAEDSTDGDTVGSIDAALPHRSTTSPIGGIAG